MRDLGPLHAIMSKDASRRTVLAGMLGGAASLVAGLPALAAEENDLSALLDTLPIDDRSYPAGPTAHCFDWPHVWRSSIIDPGTGERRIERHYGSLHVIARCVGMHEVPYWSGGPPPGHEPFFEFLALAEDAGTDWPPVVEPSRRLVFFDQALAGSALPQGRLTMGAARDDLMNAMLGFAGLIQKEHMLATNPDWEIAEVAGIGRWSGGQNTVEGRAFAYPADRLGLSTVVRRLNADIDRAAEDGFDGGILLNWRMSHASLKAKAHVPKRLDAFLSAVLRRGAVGGRNGHGTLSIHNNCLVPDQITAFVFGTPRLG